MRPTSRPIRPVAHAGAFAAALMLGGGALAQTPPGPGAPAADSARFSMQPVEGGLMRLDTRTGAMSFCSLRAQAWVCEAVPDDRAALEAEIGRLQARLAAQDKGGAGVPDIMAPPQAGPGATAPDAAPPPASAPGGDEELPAQARERLDQAVDLAEHAFRRFVEMIERLRKDLPQDMRQNPPPHPPGEGAPPPPKGEGL